MANGIKISSRPNGVKRSTKRERQRERGREKEKDECFFKLELIAFLQGQLTDSQEDTGRHREAQGDTERHRKTQGTQETQRE